MDTLGRMRKLGFRKWYERQLIESHFYLITCFLGIIMAASAVELSGRRDSLGGLLFAAGLGLGGCVLSLFGWQRYKRIMMVAEHIGDHANTNPVTWATDSDAVEWSLWGLDLINRRAGLLRIERALADSQIDPYSFQRSAYLQQRRNLVYDGNPPKPDFDFENPDNPPQ